MSQLGITRRQMITRGALSVGFVWSTPVIHTVRLGTAPGTPPPETTTSSPTSTVIAFGGEIPRSPWTYDDTVPGCFAFTTFTFATDLSTLGESTVAVEFCTGINPPTFPVSSGTFSLSAGDGSLNGVVSGGQVGPLVRLDPFTNALHLDITITGGTGAFGQATGTATIDGFLETDANVAPAAPIAVYGQTSGTITVP
jgi:hypothetical protein